MLVKVIKPGQLSRIRPSLLAFVNSHSDERITHRGIRWLTDLSGKELKMVDGNCMMAAFEKKKLIGLLAVSQFGIDHSFLVVHHDYRQKGIAKRLIHELFSRMDKFYARVAIDNISSLHTCFSMGMVARKIIKGPTGKPTFIMEWGKFDKNQG